MVLRVVGELGGGVPGCRGSGAGWIVSPCRVRAPAGRHIDRLAHQEPVPRVVVPVASPTAFLVQQPWGGRQADRPLLPGCGYRWVSPTRFAPAASQPGVKWVGDITCIRTWEGFVYLATVAGLLHQEGGRIRDWADHARHRLRCARRSIWRPAGARTRQEETVFHSDRGCQYTSEQLSRHLGRYEINASTGRTGVCWAGALGRSRRAPPSRNERVYQMVYPTSSKAVRDTASWVELEYN